MCANTNLSVSFHLFQGIYLPKSLSYPTSEMVWNSSISSPLPHSSSLSTQQDGKFSTTLQCLEVCLKARGPKQPQYLRWDLPSAASIK